MLGYVKHQRLDVVSAIFDVIFTVFLMLSIFDGNASYADISDLLLRQFYIT